MLSMQFPFQCRRQCFAHQYTWNGDPALDTSSTTRTLLRPRHKPLVPMITKSRLAWSTSALHAAGAAWVLVSEPGFLLGFGSFSWKSNYFTRNEVQEQHSLLDTIFDYIFYFGPPGKYLCLSPQNLLHVGRRSRPTCSRFS